MALSSVFPKIMHISAVLIVWVNRCPSKIISVFIASALNSFSVISASSIMLPVFEFVFYFFLKMIQSKNEKLKYCISRKYTLKLERNDFITQPCSLQ